LTYEDAVRILGGGEQKLLKYLDRASMVALIAIGGFNLFDMREQIVRFGGELITKLSERLRGIDRLTRAERLAAAHHVIVITAFFDALGEIIDNVGPVSPRRITAADELAIASAEHVHAGWRSVVDGLTAAVPEQRSPLDSRETAREKVMFIYIDLIASVYTYIKIALWDGFNETQRDRFGELLDGISDSAIEKYDELFRRLVADCPEFAVWVGFAEHQATRDEVRAGLATLESLLYRIASGALPDSRRAALSRAYQAALRKPITVGGVLSTGLQIPTLGEG
jgi:hypothetical protein